MKKYTTPEIEVVFIDNTEIIVSSDFSVNAGRRTTSADGRERYDDDDDF